jgi:2-hydroxychromene-2-carboxylate isomerase
VRTLDFFFDLSSPYSYLAATQLPALAARTGAEVHWKPFVLGAVFKATANVMPASSPAKARYMLRDLDRWARRYGVPFRMSSRFPVQTIRTMRLVLVGEDEGRAQAVALAAFAALWVQDRDITSDGEIGEIAREAGLEATTALQRIEEPSIKDRLRANTEDAIARGAFGAPALFVGDELFWGNDRLDQVEEALRAPSPSR